MKILQIPLFLISFAFSCHAQTSTDGLEQAQIKGLLVFELKNGSLASQASQMNATVVPHKSFAVAFNQKVGEQMKAATEEVEKFIRIRHPEKLPEKKIELAFSNKYSLKDGPSAAVVCALLADSIITGKEIDPGFAATGDMTATGAVRPVGGVSDKIRGAIEKKCTVVAIPESNQLSISDSYILNGIDSLYQIQICTLSTFEDASALASMERDEKVQQGLDEFAQVQAVLRKNPKYVYNNKVKEKLRTVFKLIPNHLSAKLLLLHGLDKGPSKLSLIGSLNGIDNAGAELGIMIENNSYMKSGGNDDVLSGLVSNLHRLRPQLDKRTWPYADAYRGLAEFIQGVRSRKTWNGQLDREFKSSLSEVNSERDKLLSEPEIQEELNSD